MFCAITILLQYYCIIIRKQESELATNYILTGFLMNDTGKQRTSIFALLQPSECF